MEQVGATAPVKVQAGESSVFPFAGVHVGRALLMLDEGGRVKYCSPEAARWFGVSAQALLGLPVTRLLPGLPIRPDTPGYNLALVTFQFRDGRWQGLTARDAAGGEFPVEATLAAMELDAGHLLLLELRAPRPVTADDERLLHLREVVEMSGDSVTITNIHGVIEYVNPAFEAITGYRKEEALGRTHAILRSGRLDHGFYQQMWSALAAGKSFRGVFVNRRKNGELFHEDKVIRPFLNADGRITHFISSGRDVSDRVRIMRRLEHLAHHDGLTGLPNRNLFMDRLQQAVVHASRSGSGFALLLLDLDRFKAINDNLGHAAGDAVLQTAAFRLKQCVREEDTVSRLGGDEFAVILTEAGLREDVLKVLEKIAALVCQPATIEGSTVPIQASIGVALYPGAGEDGRTLLKQADSAMYQAKAAGGSGHHFFDKDDGIQPLYSGWQGVDDAKTMNAKTGEKQ